MIVYKVKDGENLFSISQKFNTTVAKLKELNKIDVTKCGERLIILPGNNDYTLGPFETLESVAKKFNANIESLKELNGNTAMFGEIITLKNNE